MLSFLLRQIFGFLIFLLALWRINDGLPRNITFLAALIPVNTQETNINIFSTMQSISSKECRVHWQTGVYARRIGELSIAESSWSNLLKCNPKAIDWIMVTESHRIDIAWLASQIYSDQYQAWYWLADIASKDDPYKAIHYFEKSAQLKPKSGLPWCRIGVIYDEQQDFINSYNAFIQCCTLGDSEGYDGCWGAGIVAEKMGNLPLAIQNYLKTRYKPSRDRAAELERQLHLTPAP